MESTTETKVDKRTKSYKELKEESSNYMNQIEQLKSSGIPLKMAVFHRTILSYGGSPAGIPESGLYAPAKEGEKPHSAHSSRTAHLWYTPNGLLIEQKGKYKLIPLANVSDTTIL